MIVFDEAGTYKVLALGRCSEGSMRGRAQTRTDCYGKLTTSSIYLQYALNATRVANFLQLSSPHYQVNFEKKTLPINLIMYFIYNLNYVQCSFTCYAFNEI